MFVTYPQDMYGGPLDETAVYVIEKTLDGGIVMLERCDRALYFGDRYWLVEAEFVKVK